MEKIDIQDWGLEDSIRYFLTSEGMKMETVSKVLDLLKGSADKIRDKKKEVAQKDISGCSLREGLEPYELFMVDVALDAGWECGALIQEFKLKKNHKYDLALSFSLGILLTIIMGVMFNLFQV